MKLFLISALERGHQIITMDINHALLYAPIEETLYIEHPKDRGKVTPLLKSLYGLKQSPKNWNDTLREFLNKNGYFGSEYSPGLYVSQDDNTVIAAYVDDTMISAPDEDTLDRIIDMFKQEFDLEEDGITDSNGIVDVDVLGIDLIYDTKNLTCSL